MDKHTGAEQQEARYSPPVISLRLIDVRYSKKQAPAKTTGSTHLILQECVSAYWSRLRCLFVCLVSVRYEDPLRRPQMGRGRGSRVREVGAFPFPFDRRGKAREKRQTCPPTLLLMLLIIGLSLHFLPISPQT